MEASIVASDVEDGAIIEDEHVKNPDRHLMISAHIPFGTPHSILYSNGSKLWVRRERRGSVRLLFYDVSKWWFDNYFDTHVEVSDNADSLALVTNPIKIVPSLNVSEDLRATVECISYWVDTYSLGGGTLVDVAFDVSVWRNIWRNE